MSPMRLLAGFVSLVFTLMLSAGAGRSETALQAGSAVTLILMGGRILTLTPQDGGKAPTAVAVADGRVLYVGDDRGALALRTASTHVEDLKGATVVPGFIDSHCHFYGLGKALDQIDLVGTVSVQEAVARVVAAAAAAPGEGWLEGRGWDQNDWPGKEFPHKGQLDAVEADRPILLRRIDGHAAWVNSAALLAAGIGAFTPDPAGGTIVRDGRGEPSGILIDNAVDLVVNVVPPPGAELVRRRLRLAGAHCVRYGLTGVHEAGLSVAELAIYGEMAAAGELPVRVYGMFDDKPDVLQEALRRGPVIDPDGMLTVRAVKLYADGALGSRGALLLADYQDRPGHRGLTVTSPEHLREVARDLGRAGFQICTHAIGDGANRLVLDIYAKVLDELHLADPRWRIEHAQILDSADIPRFAALGVIAAMQPTHCTSDMDWAAERLGPRRLAGAYAWKSLLAGGAHLCFGTDFPVEAADPLAGLYAARTRTHPDGTPAGGWLPAECLDARTALELYTVGSAYAAFQEGELGRIAPGFRADFTVLDDDPVACPPQRLLSMAVLLTVVDGTVVYRRE